MAPRPVPVMCEQLPLTEGIFRDEITKTKAPEMAMRVRALRFFFTVFRRVKKPASRKGRQITPQAMQKAGGRYPSMMCMAEAAGRIPRLRARPAAMAVSFFCGFVRLLICIKHSFPSPVSFRPAIKKASSIYRFSDGPQAALRAALRLVKPRNNGISLRNGQVF